MEYRSDRSITRVKKIAAILAALFLIGAPVSAQEMPEPGTVVVVAYVYDGVSLLEVPTYIVVPPVVCDPS